MSQPAIRPDNVLIDLCDATYSRQGHMISKENYCVITVLCKPN